MRYVPSRRGPPLASRRGMQRTLLALLLATAGLAFARHPKISADLDGLPPDKTVDVIIQYKHVPSEAHHQRVRGRGGLHKRSLDVIRGSLYSVPAGAMEELAADPDVAFISPDREVRGALDLTAAAVNAGAAATYKLDGTGIGIAVLDSGVNYADDLDYPTTRVVYNQDFTGEGRTNDPYGHGTHVSGAAAGSGYDSNFAKISTRTFKGIAPNANIINLRVLNSQGAGSDSAVIAAIQRAIALKSQYNIRVMNLSLGRPVYGSYTQDPLCQAVESAWNAGIVVVVAAGNQGRNNNGGIDGYGTITSPGNDPYVITVGAMKTMNTPGRTDDQIASYSSKGPTLYDHVVKPDLVAPGNQVRSTYGMASSMQTYLWANYSVTHLPASYYLLNQYPGSVSGNYDILSGTSMATPVVSGAAALLIQQHPSLTPDQVKARLMKTAYKTFPASSTATDSTTGQTYTSYYDIFTIGAGYLDIQAALANSDLANGSALSPTAVYNSATNNGALSFAAGSTWGTSVAWGTNVVWGTTNGFNVVWGTGTNGTIDPANVVWGTSGTAIDATVIDPMAVLTQGEK